MRKILVLLIVSTMVIGGVAFLCDCCPAYAAESTTAPMISSPDCTCCPDALEVSKNDLATRSNQEFSFTSSVVRLLSLSFIMVNGTVEPFRASTHSSDSSPPGRTSDTPLYLALEVLRL